MTLPDSHLEIDLGRLDANLTGLRRTVGPGVKICGVVKADAYGLGAVRIAQRLASKQIDLLAVYSAQQACELTTAGLTVPMLLLTPIRSLDRTDPLYRAAVLGRLHLSIYDLPQVQQLNGMCGRLGIRLPVHLFIDTGMGRGGVRAGDVSAMLQAVTLARHLRLAGVYTHFAAAEMDPAGTDGQLAIFDRLLEEHAALLDSDTLIHVANTYATLRDAKYHKNMVRSGIGLHGYGSAKHPADTGLQPILRWLSRVIHIQHQPSGARVGYSGTHTLTRDSRVAIVPVGFGDGYPLALGNKAQVRIDGQDAFAPVIGKVSMDQIIIDLTDLPQVQLHDAVVVYDNQHGSPCCLSNLARLAESTCYELCCRLSGRIARRYVSRPASPSPTVRVSAAIPAPTGADRPALKNA